MLLPLQLVMVWDYAAASFSAVVDGESSYASADGGGGATSCAALPPPDPAHFTTTKLTLCYCLLTYPILSFTCLSESVWWLLWFPGLEKGWGGQLSIRFIYVTIVDAL